MSSLIDINGTKIEIVWKQHRNKNRPFLIFLHEGLGCVEMWKDFPEKLAQKVDCPFLIYSRPGYGKSDPWPLPWKINFMHIQALKFLPAILKKLAITKYILAGHSDGGSIAVIFAGKSIHPGLMGIITEAAHVFCEPVTIESIRHAKKAYEHNGLKKALEKYHGKNTDNAFKGWNEAWLNPGFIHWNIEKYLKKIKVPMLALQGRDDQYGTCAQLESIKKNVKNVRTGLIDACGHAPHAEQPENTMDIMAKFIESLICTRR